MTNHPSHEDEQEEEIGRFCWQYLQLEAGLDYPRAETLREEPHQERIYKMLFGGEAPTYRPPHRYQLRVLKELARRIEASIDDWEQHGVSENLASALADLIAQPLQSETTAAQQKSYVTYHVSSLPGEPSSGLPTTASAAAATDPTTTTATTTAAPRIITLLESRSLIAASGTTGLRTWEATLHLGNYLCANPETVAGKRVLELGAGTGYLSVLCAAHLGASHVIASDGSEDVVNNLPENMFLNGVRRTLPGEGEEDAESSGCCGGGDDREILGKWKGSCTMQPMELRWGHALVGTEESVWNGRRRVDVVLGADITYDRTVIPMLVATLEELVCMYPGVEVLISATERNRSTYESFLERAKMSGFRVEDVVFPVDGTRGPFFDRKVPIHICRLGRG